MYLIPEIYEYIFSELDEKINNYFDLVKIDTSYRFFLNGKKVSCDYGPEARVLKNINNTIMDKKLYVFGLYFG